MFTMLHEGYFHPLLKCSISGILCTRESLIFNTLLLSESANIIFNSERVNDENVTKFNVTSESYYCRPAAPRTGFSSYIRKSTS